MAESTRAVLAGSKGFVEAVDAPLRMRFGPAIGVAEGPGDALARSPSCELVVLEYAGAEWLEAVKAMRGRAPSAPAIVVGVPTACAGDTELLKHAGVDEVVAWSGRPDPLVWAIDRIQSRRAARTAGAPPRLPTARDGATAQGSFAPAAPGAPRVPAQAPSPRSGPEPAALASTPAPAPAGAAPPRASPAEPSVAAPQDEVAAPPPEVDAAAGAQPALEVVEVAELFPEAEDPATAAPPSAPGAWPSAVPSASDAERLLAETRTGKLPEDETARAAVDQVLKSLSDIERAALDGWESQIDPAQLRASVSLRVRLEIALATAPAEGGGVEQGAAQNLLADVDAQLAQLATLAREAPAGVAPALEPARSALVDAGLRIANALDRARAVEDAPAPTAPKPEEREPGTRVLTNEHVLKPERRLTVASVLLALALAIAFAYHGSRLLHRPPPPPSVALAPRNTVGAADEHGKFVTALAGKSVDPAEVARFKAAEEARGNTVTEVAPGTWLVLPSHPPRPGPATGGTP